MKRKRNFVSGIGLVADSSCCWLAATSNYSRYLSPRTKSLGPCHRIESPCTAFSLLWAENDFYSSQCSGWPGHWGQLPLPVKFGAEVRNCIWRLCRTGVKVVAMTRCLPLIRGNFNFFTSIPLPSVEKWFSSACVLISKSLHNGFATIPGTF